MKKVWILGIILVLSISLYGCTKDENQIVIASKPMTEQYIIVEMLTQLVEEHTDIKVEQKLGIGGGTTNIHPAMLSGEIDVYPEYTGTGWLTVLKKDLIRDPEELYQSVKTEYEENYDIKWLDLYGFNNTYILAVNKDIAEQFNLKTYSDLSQHANQLTFGANYDFYEREDGFPGLTETYNLEFKNTVEMDIGLRYEAINQNQIDIMPAFSTDGRLNQYDFVFLEDDLMFFPAYHCTTLVRQETLAQFPELEDVLNMLAGQISNKDMMEMNYQVEIENQDPKTVAIEFLTKKGLL
ncbi:glycine betaine ABC transporter substrate-binding protein [Serpentinicella sp. ANB-PHB4]|uniref:glycine betaine ABC transporter substrate-binding protein n=1 Tax=Serpentinicella sp. ANB-PHB4 TaxID=3074076 RepID=UPI00285DA009|nr:glycine betaine ABC transporter substrate-binding protein [Serpentinicella sp. ANB-PHB4]MDR5658465.1 glycine betaine ABC transporter substrate-binding protein [Serpentinicella sp. ANB-PHB4]